MSGQTRIKNSRTTVLQFLNPISLVHDPPFTPSTSFLLFSPGLMNFTQNLIFSTNICTSAPQDRYFTFCLTFYIFTSKLSCSTSPRLVIFCISFFVLLFFPAFHLFYQLLNACWGYSCCSTGQEFFQGNNLVPRDSCCPQVRMGHKALPSNCFHISSSSFIPHLQLVAPGIISLPQMEPEKS